MTFNEIENEFDKKFGFSTEEEIKEYQEQNFDKDKLASAGCDNCEYNQFWRGEIKSFLKQSFIKYLQSEVERLEKSKKEILPYKEGEKSYSQWLIAEGYNLAISYQITHLQAQIKELDTSNN